MFIEKFHEEKEKEMGRKKDHALDLSLHLLNPPQQRAWDWGWGLEEIS